MLVCIKECHDKKIAHLDIKCENYMVRKVIPPQLILIDFGHAEKIDHATMKHGQSSYGTCFYLCPEGYNKYFSMKSDSWSIGICAHLLLTGDYPFIGDDDEYAENVCKGNIKISSKLSPGALKFIKGSLHYDPALRIRHLSNVGYTVVDKYRKIIQKIIFYIINKENGFYKNRL